MRLLDLIFRRKTKRGVAVNILAAQYTLRRTSPSVIKSAIEDIGEHLTPGSSQDNPRDVYTTFFQLNRHKQLNILAQAFYNIDIPPLLKGERWTLVKNPLLASIYDEDTLQVVQGKFYKTYGKYIEIPEEPITTAEIDELTSES